MSEEEKRRLPHRLAKNFVSAYTSGQLITGPGPDGMYTVMFYVDAWGIEAENMNPVEGMENAYTITPSPDASGYFREDIARLMMSKTQLEAMKELISHHLGKEGPADG